VVASRIFSVEDIVNDPTYTEREAATSVEDAELGSVRMQGVVTEALLSSGNGVDGRAFFRS